MQKLAAIGPRALQDTQVFPTRSANEPVLAPARDSGLRPTNTAAATSALPAACASELSRLTPESHAFRLRAPELITTPKNSVVKQSWTSRRAKPASANVAARRASFINWSAI